MSSEHEKDEKARRGALLAAKYASKMLRSERAQVDASLRKDFAEALLGNVFYIPNLLAETKDLSFLSSLTKELKQSPSNSIVNWSQHLKLESPEFSPTFNQIVKQLSEYFEVEVYATRLNFYPDGGAWKPFHHDSHAFGSNGKKEDFTIGASFGASRALAFLHPSSGQVFEFPQNNGDVFAFSSEANKTFQHGVPKLKSAHRAGIRFSIIAWGRRRSFNARNCGKIRDGKIVRRDQVDEKKAEVQEKSSFKLNSDSESQIASCSMDEVCLMVEKLVVAQQEKPKTNALKAKLSARNSVSRVQGGWASAPSLGTRSTSSSWKNRP